MNVCIVSTFEGTTEDYMDMFNATKEKAHDFMTVPHGLQSARAADLAEVLSVQRLSHRQSR